MKREMNENNEIGKIEENGDEMEEENKNMKLRLKSSKEIIGMGEEGEDVEFGFKEREEKRNIEVMNMERNEKSLIENERG